MMRKLWLVAVLAASQAWADEPAPDAGWTGRVDLGFFSQSGSAGGKESLTFKTDLNRRWGDFTLENHAEAISASSDSDGGSARYLVSSKQRLALNATDYVFLREQFEKDSTSEFSRQYNLTSGLGRTFFSDDTQSLVAEAGAGVRHSIRKQGKDETSPIVTVGADYRYHFSKTTEFRQRAGFEGGRDANILRSLTELREALSLALGYDIKREYSDASQHLNVTTVSLSYLY
ncbi:MAG: DUF481 domain-containing protein [Perlucidibaca sp.]